MISEYQSKKLITGQNVRHYFQDSVQTAIRNQQMETSEHAQFYVVNMLADFTRSDVLYEDTPDGRMIKPLVKFYSDAVSASSSQDANNALKRLGDVALFIAGLFAHSLQRSLVDVDYYIAMGGSAYDSLAAKMSRSLRGRSVSEIYQELAEQFAQWVDVLAEVSDEFKHSSDQDVLRLYEIWMLTGSPQAARKLRQLGIQPARAAVSRSQH